MRKIIRLSNRLARQSACARAVLDGMAECADYARKRRDGVKAELEALEARNAEAEKRFSELSAASQDSQALRELAEELENSRIVLNSLRSVYESLQEACRGFADTAGRLDACVTLGRYRYVARVAPIGKIRRLTYSERAEDVTVLTVLLLSISRDISDRIKSE